MFKLKLQFAHHELSEADETQASANEVAAAFENYEWESEIQKSLELKRCSPTIAVESGERLIWLSGVGDPDSPSFISECSFPGVVRKWFGLTKGRGLVSLYAKSFSETEARKALRYFLEQNENGLRELYAKA